MVIEMSHQDEERLGVAHALLDRLNKQRLPWLLEVERRVNAGERLSDVDLGMLEMVLREAQENEHVLHQLVEKFPELQGIVSRVVDLYRSISTKAMENEQQAGQP